LLEDLSMIGNLFVCSAGKEKYCDAVVDAIDPDKKYFKRENVYSTDGHRGKSLVKVFSKPFILKNPSNFPAV